MDTYNHKVLQNFISLFQDQPDTADDSSAEFESYYSAMVTLVVMNVLVYSSAAVMHFHSSRQFTLRHLIPSQSPRAPPFPSLPPPALPHEVLPQQNPRAKVVRWDSINSLYISAAGWEDEEHVYDEWNDGADKATDTSC